MLWLNSPVVCFDTIVRVPSLIAYGWQKCDIIYIPLSALSFTLFALSGSMFDLFILIPFVMWTNINTIAVDKYMEIFNVRVKKERIVMYAN